MLMPKGLAKRKINMHRVCLWLIITALYGIIVWGALGPNGM